jgi:N-acetylneuraminate synthase
MVDRTRELELALGTGEKQVEPNERDTVVVQRRSLRAKTDLPAGTMLAREHLDVLRPAPSDGIPPYELVQVLGCRLRRPVSKGMHLTWFDVER